MPNTTPIYPRDIFTWKAVLTNQVVPRTIITQTPVTLGEAGDNGSLIHTIYCRHLGDNVQTVARLWIKRTNDTLYFLENELTLTATSSTTNDAAIAPVPFTLPAILPSGNTGLHLEPGEILYCALGTSVAAGVIITARGGDY